eukprot:TRINITY_DN2302_c1_g1_i5.p2 TRINITY_DN2302_c1_g1~~TRINITY_DN2302_c1_g1_i5.p2  ORF type:complete len:289 (-),score=27.68 TRINITY_DN2302_c1_g1_i5:250-1116(-)
MATIPSFDGQLPWWRKQSKIHQIPLLADHISEITELTDVIDISEHHLLYKVNNGLNKSQENTNQMQVIDNPSFEPEPRINDQLLTQFKEALTLELPHGKHIDNSQYSQEFGGALQFDVPEEQLQYSDTAQTYNQNKQQFYTNQVDLSSQIRVQQLKQEGQRDFDQHQFDPQQTKFTPPRPPKQFMQQQLINQRADQQQRQLQYQDQDEYNSQIDMESMVSELQRLKKMIFGQTSVVVDNLADGGAKIRQRILELENKLQKNKYGQRYSFQGGNFSDGVVGNLPFHKTL